MTVLSAGSLLVPSVLPANLTLTIIDVVMLVMRIIRVIDNQSAAQAITILVLEMAVVPERPLQDTIDEAPEKVVRSSLLPPGQTPQTRRGSCFLE